jgi:hypothetical protein
MTAKTGQNITEICPFNEERSGKVREVGCGSAVWSLSSCKPGKM